LIVKDIKRSAPVALFTYRRPVHLARTLRALQSNSEASRTELFVFSDNPKSSADSADVEAVRSLLRTISGFAVTHIVCRETNFGLARNITDGVSAVLAQRESVIVIEDDIVVSPFFLRFMNEALQRYGDVPRVGSISGYCYPLTSPVPETYFIRGADCWGWATWRDRWLYYNADSGALAAELESRSLLHAFDFDGTASFSQMLMDHTAGKNESWAIRWHASCYLRDLLILYPGRALAQNIGRDGTGTHSTTTDESLNVMLSPSPIVIGNVPIEENTQAREAIKNFFRAQGGAKTSALKEAVTKRKPLPLRQRAVSVLLPPVRNILRHCRPRSGGVPQVEKDAALTPVNVLPDRRYWGLDNLDQQVEKYLNFDGGFFVELGANDGRFQSNTYYYERFRNWRGVLIEPAPNLFLRCRENRSPENHIVCAACVSFDYKEEFVKIVYSNSMSVSLNVETDIADPLAHAELGRQFLSPGETIFTFGAVAASLNSILVDANAPKLIDFLSIDVEGSELDVLKGINHDSFCFRYMLVECRNLPRLNDYLESKCYRLLEKFNEHDYLFAGTRAIS
jgi:FkbM family methyltransferase